MQWRWSWRVGLLLCVWLCGSGVVRGEVIEPNGVAVPLDSNNGETQLSTLFSDRSEQIDFIADGNALPDTFSPLCGFQATFVLKQSGSSLGVGWYNADAMSSSIPTAAEVHEIVPAGSAVGTVITGANIRGDAAYAGGSIGFALLRDPLSFTQSSFNTQCALCTTAGPWILAVSYASTQTLHAYYVAFEDGDANELGWSNDGDFNDYVFLFEGLSCVGEGEACTVPDAKGVCIPGVQECDAGGALICKSSIAASSERCDGLDNDCNGLSDDGDDLCEASEVCSRGRCVPRCNDTEFPCASPPFTLCEEGVCIEPECAGKTCAEGQACIGGQCRAPCDDIICPLGQVCRLGACVDPCAGVSCEGERVCSAGACVLGCSCTGCKDGSVCEASSQLCVDPGCETRSCASGERCAEDRCIDACQDAVCPAGTTCLEGECAAEAISDAGTPMQAGTSGTAFGAGTGPQGAAGVEPSDDLGAAGGGGTGITAGAGATVIPIVHRKTAEPAGCGCHIADATAARNGLLSTWLAAIALCLAARRRSRRAYFAAAVQVASTLKRSASSLR